MNTATISLQPATPADALALLDLARIFHAEDGHALDEAGERAVARAAAGDPLLRAWFVLDGPERIGYAVLTLGFSILHGGRDGFIDDLYLVPAARGKGIGQPVLAGRAEALYAACGYEASPRKLMSKRLL